MPKKDTYTDRVDGGILDLSLLELTVVPVKELVDIPKAKQLDLSCNLLTTIPPDISRLTHIVHLDLSKNQITSLPDSIGGLHRLQHFDLFQNRLTSLPVGFCHLKNLKWLDLKDNPLEPTLSSIAGDCLDDKECRSCATKVVAFMKKVDSEQERIKQRKLAFEREEAAKRKAIEDEELDKIRQLKKAERQARKLERTKAQKAKEEELSRNKPMFEETDEEISDENSVEISKKRVQMHDWMEGYSHRYHCSKCCYLLWCSFLLSKQF